MSITTQKINSHPRLTSFLVGQDVFRFSPLTVIDVGARGGFEKHWDIYGNQIRLIGFEINAEECERLNKNSAANQKYYPIGLSRKKGMRTFNIQRHIASSSFYRSREDFLRRFPAWEDLIPHMTAEVLTTDLDSFAGENNIKPDFLKLDIEGAELDVFKGSTRCFGDSVFGVSTEAVFYPWREGMPTFSDIDIFLRALGFVLYDLPIFRWERKTLSPFMFKCKGVFGPTERGQIIWTQAVYFKDPIPEFKRGIIRNWPPERVLKLASLLELYNLEDCVIELLQIAAGCGLLTGYNVNGLVDLATPLLGGEAVSYSEYIDYIRQQGPPKYIDGKQVSAEKYERIRSE